MKSIYADENHSENLNNCFFFVSRITSSKNITKSHYYLLCNSDH